MKTSTLFAIGLLLGITASASAQRIVVASGLAAFPAPTAASAAPASAPAPAAPTTPTPAPAPQVTIILPPSGAHCAPAYSPCGVVPGGVCLSPLVRPQPANVVYFGGYSSQSHLYPGYPGYSGRYPGSRVVYYGRGESFRQGYYFNRDR